MSLM